MSETSREKFDNIKRAEGNGSSPVYFYVIWGLWARHLDGDISTDQLFAALVLLGKKVPESVECVDLVIGLIHTRSLHSCALVEEAGR